MAGAMTCLDVCAGAGGMALGLERAGFSPVALVEEDAHACATLRANRPMWQVVEQDLLEFDPDHHPETYDVDLLSAGLPRLRSAASVARAEDSQERKLLMATVWLCSTVLPRALLIENVPGLVTSKDFVALREDVGEELQHLGYECHWGTVNAMDFGVPQDRKQGILVALKKVHCVNFVWPEPNRTPAPTVGDVLRLSMGSRGWPHADCWAAHAQRQAPAVVGGSKNRGGADLGPTGSKAAWARIGVNGHAVGDEVPGPDDGWDPDGEVKKLPKLTIPQVARLQAFPEDWELRGGKSPKSGKTSKYRQLGHASPPPVAQALGLRIAAALTSSNGR